MGRKIFFLGKMKRTIYYTFILPSSNKSIPVLFHANLNNLSVYISHNSIVTTTLALDKFLVLIKKCSIQTGHFINTGMISQIPDYFTTKMYSPHNWVTKFFRKSFVFSSKMGIFDKILRVKLFLISTFVSQSTVV